MNLYAMSLLTMENSEGVLLSYIQKGNIGEDWGEGETKVVDLR